MKGCSTRRDAIADCALGKTPEPGLAAHLASCPQCRNALRDSRAMAARIDEALPRGAAAEPPLLGPERVMARVIGQADTRGGWTRGFWRRAAMGSALAAVLIAIAIWALRPSPEAEVMALSGWRSPTQALLRPPVAAAWATRPRLGEGFFKIKSSGEIHAQ